MYFCKFKNSSKGFFGKTLSEAYDNLNEEDGYSIEECTFYKADVIKVELQEVQVTKKVVVAKKSTIKK